MHKIHIPILLLLVPAMMWGAPGVGLHIFLSFESLQRLDVLASGRIENLDGATAYVRQAAAQYGATDPALLPDGLESSFAAAELDAAKDPTKLVSDDQVAEAFNFLSDEFRVPNPQRLTRADILQYRSVQAALWPNIFSPKSVSGSRPVGAIVMLSQLVYSGGVTEGVRSAAKLDRPPGSLRITGGQIVGKKANPAGGEAEYRAASRRYFGERTPAEIHVFIEKVADIIVVPEGR